MATEAAGPPTGKPRRQAFRGGVAIVTAVVTVVAVLLIVGWGLLFSESRQTMRLTSPDGRTDLVLTWRGGGGAAGWTEESVALEPHGPPKGDGDELATFDPNAFVGARWLSNRVAEIRLLRLVEAMRSRTLPTTVRVGAKVVTLKVRWQASG